ncbi:MAG TPA: hypothetical protein PLV21_06860 [Cyclobacteriaceae bacterium]|nr:hypothetical protein [Cyclobacteriaceae bacterium]HRJ81584.1 hypothetical protein [Cyclobacteriaceae bacterium]
MTRKLVYLLLTLVSPSWAQLNMIETNDMRLVSYDFGHKYVLPHAGRCFHSALDFHRKLFDYEPTEKITVLIQDFGDFGNGGATAVPRNAISMGLSPFSYTFETSPAGERVFSLMNHELVHVVALDNSGRTDRFYQKLFFGKVSPTNTNPISAYYSYLTSPRRYSPRWYHEGIASYVETWMSGGIGLAMGSYDEMVFRTRVLENARIYTAQGLESEGTTTDFQGKTNSYLYGTRFMGYLANEYGPDKIIEWVKRKDGSRRSYSAQFKNVFGKSLNNGWRDWLRFERDWQNNNVERLKEFPITETQSITEKTIGSVSYPHYDKTRNNIYMAVNYPGQTPHLAALHLQDGKLEKLADIKGAALFYVSSVTYDAEADMLYFTTDNDAWRDLNSYNIKTGKVKRLQKDFRTGDLAFNKVDKSIWGIKHLNGFSTIVRIPKENPDQPQAPYSLWQQKYTLPYGQDIFDIDVSPDGKKLSAAVSDYKGNQSLLIYNLDSLLLNKVSVDTVFNFEVSSPQGFRFTEDGQYLYGSSYYTGVSNIFKVDLTDSMRISAMSNAVTGFFRPLKISDDKLFAFSFTSDGFQPVYVPNTPLEDVSTIEFLGNETITKHPALKTWELPMATPQQIKIEELITKEGRYQPGKLIRLNSAYPILTGYKNFVGVGYTVNLGDPLSFREIEITAAYTPQTWRNGLATEADTTNLSIDKDEQFHLSVTGKIGRLNFNFSYNPTSFYDLFGPTRTSRKGTMGRVDFTRTLLWDLPRKLDLVVGLGGFYGLEKSPEFQQIETQGFDNNLFVNFDGTLLYTNLRGSLGAVDAEKGIKAMARSISAVSNGKAYSSAMASVDLGFQLPVNHFSLWWRTSAGHSFSDAFNPFTRFGFAAFGNNYIDYQSARRYRNIFSFPGLSFETSRFIIAKSFTKSMVEFVLPPIRFRELGGLNLYSNWMQFTLFSSGLLTGDRTATDNRFVNVGSQVDFKIVIFSLMESTFSIGYANAFDLNDNNRRFSEWMVSLKLLR